MTWTNLKREIQFLASAGIFPLATRKLKTGDWV